MPGLISIVVLSCAMLCYHLEMLAVAGIKNALDLGPESNFVPSLDSNSITRHSFVEITHESAMTMFDLDANDGRKISEHYDQWCRGFHGMPNDLPQVAGFFPYPIGLFLVHSDWRVVSLP